MVELKTRFAIDSLVKYWYYDRIYVIFGILFGWLIESHAPVNFISYSCRKFGFFWMIIFWLELYRTDGKFWNKVSISLAYKWRVIIAVSAERQKRAFRIVIIVCLEVKITSIFTNRLFKSTVITPGSRTVVFWNHAQIQSGG